MSLAEQILTAFLRSAAASAWNDAADALDIGYDIAFGVFDLCESVIHDADRALGLGPQGQQTSEVRP